MHIFFLRAGRICWTSLNRTRPLRTATTRMGIRTAALFCALVASTQHEVRAEAGLPRPELVSAVASTDSFTISWSYDAPPEATAVSFRVQKKRASEAQWSTLADVCNRPLSGAIAPQDRTLGAGERRAPSTELA